MKWCLSAVLVSMLAATPALAQPFDPLQPNTTEAPPPPPPPPPAPEPPPEPESPPPTAAASARGDSRWESSGNPGDRLVGIGTGYTLPSDLDATNIVSVRFRLGRITLEPLVDLSFNKQTEDQGVMEIDTSQTTVAVGAQGRYVLLDGRGIELVGLGGALLSYTSFNPEGDENSTNTTVFRLFWGLGLDYWVSSRWVLSMSAYNPFFEHSRQSQQSNVMDDLTDSQTGVGVIFDPTVVGMVHLFF